MNIRSTFLLPAAFLFIQLTGCEEKDILQDDIIRFENSQEENLAADNYSTLKVRAIITKDADVSRRSVKFTTDIGQFSNDMAEITLTADANGYADAYIRSNKAGHGTITVTVLTYSVNKKVNFTVTDISQRIRFDNFSPDPLVADNLTERIVKVQIDKNTPTDKRKVTLTTDLGTFSNQQVTIDVIANTDGVAQTYIKGDVPGRAKLKASCNSFETEASLQFVAPDPDSIIYFISGLPATAPADGVSAIEIKVKINNAVAGAQRKVNFSTDLGSFPNGTKAEEITPDATGTGRILLRSSQEGSAFVTATHRTIVRFKAFNFERALPDKVTMTSPFTLKAGLNNSITIQTFLTRTLGKPSPDFAISYSAADSSGHSIGQFKNGTVSNSSGQCQIEFSAGSTAYRGPVTVTAFVLEKPVVFTTTVFSIID